MFVRKTIEELYSNPTLKKNNYKDNFYFFLVRSPIIFSLKNVFINVL